MRDHSADQPTLVPSSGLLKGQSHTADAVWEGCQIPIPAASGFFVLLTHHNLEVLQSSRYDCSSKISFRSNKVQGSRTDCSPKAHERSIPAQRSFSRISSATSVSATLAAPKLMGCCHTAMNQDVPCKSLSTLVSVSTPKAVEIPVPMAQRHAGWQLGVAKRNT